MHKIVSQLSNDDLVAELNRLAHHERATTVDLIVHLAEFDARGVCLGLGFPSLFAYCREVLRLSEHAAYNRIEAARKGREFPLLLERLREGALNLATVRLMAPHLTRENHAALLDEASGLSKREVEELLARRFPRPDVPPTVRRLPAPRPVAAPRVESGPLVSSPAAVPEAPVVSPAPTRPPLVAPLAPQRYEIRFTASSQTREKLRLAQDLLRHAVPSGDVAEIFDRALTVLLEDLARKKFATTERPRPGGSKSAASRHIPAQVKRTVWLRDGGRCAFVGASDRRCTATAFLEFHHHIPYAVGGEASVENIQLRCQAHNAYEADLFYGAGRGDPRHETCGIPRGARPAQERA
jgi:hypothetical protein